MTELRILAGETEEGPFAATPLPRRLPRGRHGIPADLVAQHQRLRLLAAMAEALAGNGYAGLTTTHVSERANVSTSTFYKHFGNLWDCALAAYVAGADRLCIEIEAACADVAGDEDGESEEGVGKSSVSEKDSGDDASERVAAGVEAALALFAGEAALGLLLSSQAPREASALCTARRLLVSRLAALLRRGRGQGRDESDQGQNRSGSGQGGAAARAPQPPGLDERLIDATLAFVHARIAAGEAGDLAALTPELVAILSRPSNTTSAR